MEEPALVKPSIRDVKSILRLFFTRGTIGSNGILSLISLTMQFFSNVVLVMVLARLVDVDTLGEILYGIAFAGIVSVLLSYGSNNLVIREVTQRRHSIVEIASNLLLTKLILAAVLVGAVSLFLRVQGAPLDSPGDLWFYVGAAMINSLIDSLTALRRGENDFVTEAQVSAFRSVLFFSGALAAVHWWGATTLLIGQVRLLCRSISLLFAAVLFARTLYERGSVNRLWQPKWAIIRKLLVVGFPFALQAILGTLYFQLDALVLGALRTSAEVAYYQSAMQVVSAAMLMPVAVIQAYYPRLAGSFSDHKSADLSLVKQMLIILAALGLCMTTLFGLAAPSMIRIVYGPNMEPSGLVLRILSLVFIVRAVAGGLGICLIAIGQQQAQVVAGSVALVGSLGLNLLLVPRLGFVAAAWVNLIVNLLVLSTYALWWNRSIVGWVLASETCQE